MNVLNYFILCIPILWIMGTCTGQTNQEEIQKTPVNPVGGNATTLNKNTTSNETYLARSSTNKPLISNETELQRNNSRLTKVPDELEKANTTKKVSVETLHNGTATQQIVKNITTAARNTTVTTKTSTPLNTTGTPVNIPTTSTIPSIELVPWKEVPMNFGVMVPHLDEDRCIRASIEMAFEDVHSQPRFIEFEGLQNPADNNSFAREYYKLVPSYMEVGTNMSEAIHKVHNNYMNEADIKTALLGPPDNSLTYNLIEYTAVLGGIMVSYSEVNEPVEPYYVFFAPTPPSINHQFKAAVALMDYFQWNRFGILYDFSDEKYRKNPGTLREMFTIYSQRNETDVLTELGIWSQIPDPNIITEKMDVLQNNDRKIVLALVGIRGARLIFCEAYHRKMYRPKTVWVLFEELPKGWAKPLKQDVRDVNCTEEELLTAADGHIFVVKQVLRKDNVPNLNNMTTDQFVERIIEKVGKNVKCSDNFAYAYDAVWLLAKGYQAIAKSSWPNAYFYYNYLYAYNFPTALKSLQFEGLTGNIQYEEFEPFIFKRLGQIAFHKYRRNKESVFLGTHFTKDHRLETIPNIGLTLFGSNDNIPKDKAVYRFTFSNFENPLWISLWLVSFLGILIALFFFATTVVLSKRNGSKLRTPVLNCVIILGSICCYASVIIYSLDTRIIDGFNIPKVCFAFLSTLTVGFTMTFGGIFVKTWGLYKMFITPPQKEQQQSEIKDVPEWTLLAMVGVFLIIDLVILVTWVFVAPFYTSTQTLYTTANLFADTVTIEQIVRCNCNYFIQLLIGICCYKGILLLIGIFLAWQLKNAKIQVKNGANQIAIAVYNVFAVSIIGIVCASVLWNTKLYQALFAIVAICILVCTTFTLFLVFVPQIKSILYPDTDKLQPSSTLKKEVYLRHSQRRYSSHTPPRLTELSSTFSTGTLNTQISADNTSISSPTKPDNPHLALQDTLSGSSVVSYPANYLSSPVFSNITATQEPVYVDDYKNNDVIIRETGNGNPRDFGLGDDDKNSDITATTIINDDPAKESVDDEESGDTETPNITPQSFDVMLEQ